MPFLTQDKTNWKYILIVLILAIIVEGGILGYLKLFKEEMFSITRFPKIKKSEEMIKDEETLAKEMIIDFMDARMGKFGEESLARAKSHLIDNGKKTYSQIKFIDFALVGISNPHYSRYEILKSEKLNSNRFEFTVRIYESLEEQIIDYFDENIQVVKEGNSYFVDSVSRGEYVDLVERLANWKIYQSKEYGFEIQYPKDWNLANNILGAFEVYKNFNGYRCSVEVYGDLDKYLYPLEDKESYFQAFSESKVQVEVKDIVVGGLHATKVFSPEVKGREIYFFRKKLGNKNYYFNIFSEVKDSNYEYDVIMKDNKCSNMFDRIISTLRFSRNVSLADLASEPICKYRRARYEMRIYDSMGRVTGIINGSIKEEIPGSSCIFDEKRNLTQIEIPIWVTPEITKKEIFGITKGNYKLEIHGLEIYGYGSATNFSAINIPIAPGILHHYSFDWDSLREDKEGVVIFIDTDQDGKFEKTITSGRNLTCEDFIVQLKRR